MIALMKTNPLDKINQALKNVMRLHNTTHYPVYMAPWPHCRDKYKNCYAIIVDCVIYYKFQRISTNKWKLLKIICNDSISIPLAIDCSYSTNELINRIRKAKCQTSCLPHLGEHPVISINGITLPPNLARTIQMAFDKFSATEFGHKETIRNNADLKKLFQGYNRISTIKAIERHKKQCGIF